MYYIIIRLNTIWNTILPVTSAETGPSNPGISKSIYAVFPTRIIDGPSNIVLIIGHLNGLPNKWYKFNVTNFINYRDY